MAAQLIGAFIFCICKKQTYFLMPWLVRKNKCILQGCGMSLLEVMDEACQTVVERLLPSLPVVEKVSVCLSVCLSVCTSY